MASAAGLRERKKRATRSALTAAALRLAVERGPGKVTVDDIAAAADVSVRTFFNYFPTKEAAFVADDLERGRRFVAAVVAASPDTPLWELMRRAACATMCNADLPSREEALKQRVVRTSPVVVAEVLGTFARLEQDLVVTLARRSAGKGALHARLMANAAIGAVRAATDTWLAGDDPSASFSSLLDQAFAALTPSFGNPEDASGRGCRSGTEAS